VFSEACGASGPLVLEWADERGGGPHVVEFDAPAVVVGRGPLCGLVIDDPGVSRRHAYLQMIEGRLFAVDLGSRGGLRWDGVPRPSGWVDPGRPLDVGPARIRVVSGHDVRRPADAGPGPSSSRYQPAEPLPEVALEWVGKDGEGARLIVDRPLTLVGSSKACQVRLNDPRASRFACGLVLNPSGLWAVDLLSGQGITANGARFRGGRLEDGDRLGVGVEGASLRTVYHVGRSSRPAAVPARYGGPPHAPSFPTPSHPAAALVPELLRPLFDRDESFLGDGGPSGEAVLMLIRLLGDVHRDHLNLVREELEQIRRLSREMAEVKTKGRPPGAAALPTAAEESPGPARPGTEPPPVPGPPEPRPDPAAVHSLVGDRLAAWEREREGRWRKVIGLLMGS